MDSRQGSVEMIYNYPDFPKPKPHSAIVYRYGAYGDCIVASSVLPYLKRDGYHVVFNCTERGIDVLRHNPMIDDFWLQKTDEVKSEDLDKHWEKITKGFSKVVQLNQSIEVECVAVQFRDKYTEAQRRDKFNINFYENNIRKAGYDPIHPIEGNIHFTDFEQKLMKEFWAKKTNGKFTVLWCFAGSGMNKIYPWAEPIIVDFLSLHRDAMVITIGEDLCQVLNFKHPRVLNRSGVWSIRQSCLATKYADVVVSLDTGILHAAGCFDTPKVALLSVNTEENITKHFRNCITLAGYDCECYPCHLLIYDRQQVCKIGNTGACLCLENITPDMVIGAMEDIYQGKQICMSSTQQNHLAYKDTMELNA